MTELLRKYIGDTLNEQELTDLRKAVNAATDEQLAASLQRIWEESQDEEPQVDRSTVLRMQQTISERINHEADERDDEAENNSRKARRLKLLAAAAAIIALVCIASTVHFYRQIKRVEQSNILVETRENERVNVTLPDGTQVTLNELSDLNYSPNILNQANRNVTFHGEAYFNVYKDAEHPFVIDANSLKITVLGTKFNLLARQNYPESSLTLEEGKVEILSPVAQETVTLNSGQMAIIDNKSGHITLQTSEEALMDATAWKRNELTFRNAPITEVLKKIENKFGVTINSGWYKAADTFTGTFPTDNLNDIIAILEKTFHAKSTKDGRQIRFHKAE